MEALICKQCGGRINPKTMRCEYCGTYHKMEYDPWNRPFITLVEHPEVKVIGGQVCIDNHVASRADKEYINRYVRHELTARIAEALEPEVEYEVYDDIQYDRQIVRGRIRIVSPKFRF